MMSDLNRKCMYSTCRLELELPVLNNHNAALDHESGMFTGTPSRSPIDLMRCPNMLAITRNAEERPANVKLSS